MRPFLPRTITGQVVALTVASVVLAQAVGFLIYLAARPGAEEHSPIEFDTRVATIARLMAATQGAERADLLSAARRTAGDLGIALNPDWPDGEPGSDRVLEKLGPGFATAEAMGRTFVRLPDGTAFSAIRPVMDRPFAGPFLFALVFLAAGLLLFGTWAARAVTLPLRRLAAAVETSGPEDGRPVPEDGPAEVKAVAAAVGRRNTRIAALLADNARTLAAVGHDLRTPLTRLRLRADLVDDPSLRFDFIQDLDHMTALTEGALEHLRGRRTPERRIRVDCASLVSTVVDQFADLGTEVVANVPAGVEALVAPNALQRALRNLVENAIRHADHAAVEVAAAPGLVTITVADDGPGIPADERTRLLLPFERGDPARGVAHEQGLGLGLSIAREVAEAHGGSLVLTDNAPTGLRAALHLPQPAPRP